MTGRRARAAAMLVAASLVAAGALAAAAAGSGSASGVQIAEAGVSNFPDMAFTLALPKPQPLTAAQVHVSENGNPVQDVTVAKPGAEDVGVVLVIDASNSMKGQPITEAMAAARAFAARRNPGQQLGLITFNDKATVVLPLTNDQATITKALANNPELAAGTHIYDALQSAGQLLANAGVSTSSIVLLSDGQDVGSTVDQKTAVSSLADTKTRVFAVGLKSGQYDSATLQTISGDTSGTYTEASSSAALKQIYEQLGYTLSNEYLLRYRSLSGPDEKNAVAVKINGIPGTARATYTTPALPTTAPASGPSVWDKIVRSTVTLILVILTIVTLLGYAIFKILYRPDQALKRRIGQFVTLPEEEERAKERQADVAEILAQDEKRESSGWLKQFESDLEIARIELPFRTIAILTVLGGFLLGIAVSILLGSPLGLLAMLAAPFITKSIVARKLRSTRKAFSDQLPDNLDVLSSGLRTGHSFPGALAVCVDDAAEPSKGEFRRVIADDQLGVPIDEALHVTAFRMKNRDVVQMALVAKLQRDAGTNAADVLDQVADNVRARLELRRLVTTLTAQGRMARWIVSLLPVVLFVGIYLVNRSYLSILWQEPVGIAAMIAAGIMIVAGSLIIKRIIEIEV